MHFSQSFSSKSSHKSYLYVFIFTPHVNGINSRGCFPRLEHVRGALQRLVNVTDLRRVALEGKVHEGRVQRHDVIEGHVLTTLWGRERSGAGNEIYMYCGLH